MTCDECRQQLVLAEGEQTVPAAAREHLAGCVSCQEFAREGARLREQVRDLAETEHAPQALQEQVRGMVRRPAAGRALYRMVQGRARARWLWTGVAAAVVLLTLAGYGLKWYHSERFLSPSRLAQEFISDHLHYLPGKEEIVSESARDVEKWFQGRVDFPVRVPQVPVAALEDARVCNIAGRKAALLHYRRRLDDTLISVFVAEAPRTFAPQSNAVDLSASYRGLNATLWSQRGLVYSVVAALDDASLRQIAESVRQQQP